MLNNQSVLFWWPHICGHFMHLLNVHESFASTVCPLVCMKVESFTFMVCFLIKKMLFTMSCIEM